MGLATEPMFCKLGSPPTERPYGLMMFYTLIDGMVIVGASKNVTIGFQVRFGILDHPVNSIRGYMLDELPHGDYVKFITISITSV